MNYSISDTAEYGNYTRGPRLIDDSVRGRMRQILVEIQDGTFAKEWIAENKAGGKQLLALRGRSREHPIEQIGKRLRGMMSWLRGEQQEEAKAV